MRKRPSASTRRAASNDMLSFTTGFWTGRRAPNPDDLESNAPVSKPPFSSWNPFRRRNQSPADCPECSDEASLDPVPPWLSSFSWNPFRRGNPSSGDCPDCTCEKSRDSSLSWFSSLLAKNPFHRCNLSRADCLECSDERSVDPAPSWFSSFLSWNPFRRRNPSCEDCPECACEESRDNACSSSSGSPWASSFPSIPFHPNRWSWSRWSWSYWPCIPCPHNLIVKKHLAKLEQKRDDPVSLEAIDYDIRKFYIKDMLARFVLFYIWCLVISVFWRRLGLQCAASDPLFSGSSKGSVEPAVQEATIQMPGITAWAEAVSAIGFIFTVCQGYAMFESARPPSR